MSPKKTKKPKPKPIDLKLTLENFGPLRKAEIDLKPMTIFIGPNNSGKTYVATTLYSLLKAMQIVSVHATTAALLTVRSADPLSFSTDPPGRNWFAFYDAIIKSLGPDLVALGKGELDATAFFRHFCVILLSDLQKTTGQVITWQIKTSFSAETSELSRAGKQHFRLHYETGLLSLEHTSDRKKTRILGKEKSLDALYTKKLSSLCAKIKALANGKQEADLGKDEELAILLAGLAQAVQYEFWHDFLEAFGEERRRLHKREFHYLPAPRSALLEVYKPLVSALFGQMGRAWQKNQEKATMTGVASDLMTFLTNLPMREGPFGEIEAKMSYDLIQGRIALEVAHPNLPPSFSYEFKGGRIPLYRASSSVSELAPFFLYVRYPLKPGDVLIIDEPEAHLHPGAIRILAKYLVRLVRERVNLIITTHSDYLLEQLNNFILLGKVGPERRKEKYQDYEVDDFLKPEEVGAYVFNYDEKEEGYVTQELVIDEEEGLIEEEFNKVNEALYDELASLRRDVAKQSKK